MSLFSRTAQVEINSDISAAIAIHDEFIFFVEINSNGELQRKIKIPLADGCVINGEIKNFSLLEKAFSEIHKSIGKIYAPVSIGLPEGETIIRFPDVPEMSLEDLRSALDLNFSEYFPYDREEAVFDFVKVKTPGNLNKKNFAILVASARSKIVERVLTAARNAKISVGPIEPLSFAMIRATPEAHQGLCILSDAHNIAVVWNGNGIYFRVADNQHSTQDIFNTIRYVENQYFNINVEKIIFLGSAFEVENNSDDEDGIKVIAKQDEYYAALGLAMRDTPGFQSIDMTPQEFIESERRRHVFNINRPILWSLIIIFITLSVGTISFISLGIRDINDKIFFLRNSVQELMPQRIALMRENSALEQQNIETEKILNFLQENIPVLEILNELEKNSAINPGVKFYESAFSRSDEKIFTVALNGEAENEQALLEMITFLNNSKIFSEIKLPFSQQDDSGRVSFGLILKIKNGLSVN